MEAEGLLNAFKTNSVGPALVSQVALPFLEKGTEKKILHISSTGGSIGTAGHVGARFGSYSMTKAALNMLVRAYPFSTSVCGTVLITACIFTTGVQAEVGAPRFYSHHLVPWMG